MIQNQKNVHVILRIDFVTKVQDQCSDRDLDWESKEDPSWVTQFVEYIQTKFKIFRSHRILFKISL